MLKIGGLAELRRQLVQKTAVQQAATVAVVKRCEQEDILEVADGKHQRQYDKAIKYEQAQISLSVAIHHHQSPFSKKGRGGGRKR